MGVTEQLGINASGQFVPKLRITHDLSFSGKESGELINSKVNQEKLEPCMFGYTFLRIIHRIVHLRRRNPSSIIWIRKEDAKSTYRRVHINARIATKCGVQQDNCYLLLSLCLPFDGSPCPAEFCLASDVVTDVINDLLACPSLDPEKVYSNYIHKISSPKPLPSSVPFAQAKEFSIAIPEDNECKSDVFVDDIITVGILDIGNK